MDRVRILFVGEIHSTHAQSWLEMLEESEFEPRGYQTCALALPYRGELRCPTYLPLGYGRNDRPALLREPALASRLALRLGGRIRPKIRTQHAHRWLAQVLRDWRPTIVHTLGLTPGGEFYAATRSACAAPGTVRWVAQIRGGSDLTLTRADPTRGPALAAVARAADAIISDNSINFDYLEELGVRVPEERRVVVPGTGGVSVEALTKRWSSPPSHRQLILWPKAYESPWSKALPVLEALRLVWDCLPSCRVVALATDQEVESWLRQCAGPMRARIELRPRISRTEVLDLMLQARLMLGPSLVDGTPNSMWEAMACGAVPIVSPLPTIVPIVADGENTLFARNLYPDEIAAAIRRAMTDHALVDRIAATNLEVVRRCADRAQIRDNVLGFYRRILAHPPPSR